LRQYIYSDIITKIWLEYFADTEVGKNISEIIENPTKLIVPTIVINPD